MPCEITTFEQTAAEYSLSSNQKNPKVIFFSTEMLIFSKVLNVKAIISFYREAGLL